MTFDAEVMFSRRNGKANKTVEGFEYVYLFAIQPYSQEGIVCIRQTNEGRPAHAEPDGCIGDPRLVPV